MKYQSFLPVCLLLLWTLTAFVSRADEAKKEEDIVVQTISDGIKLSCKGKQMRFENGTIADSITLIYNDDNTGEYSCIDSADEVIPKIFVKYRSCDNCIELDEGTIAGLVTGNVVATIVIGVAVYLVVSQTRTSPNTSHKKSSDRQHLVPNEMPRGTNDNYQPLNFRTREHETYDRLNKQ